MSNRGLSESEVLALRPVRLAEWSEGDPGEVSEAGEAALAGEAGAGDADDSAATAVTEAAGAIDAVSEEGSPETAVRVTVVRPMPPVRGLRGLLARISALTGVKRLRLDERGSFLWRRIDGEHSIEDLAEALREAFGEAVEPAGERVALFLRSLDREHLVELRDPSGAPVKLGRV